MTTLAIESSAKASSVALARDGRLVAQYFQNSGLTHSRTLMKMVEDVLKNTETELGSLSAIAVARGPGSFTGIRIGLASAKGLALGAELPLLAVSTLRAAAAVFEEENTLLCPVMDARRGEVYNALFERRGGELHRVCDDRAISAAELARELKSSDKPILLTGDGAELALEAFAAEGVSVRLAPEMTRLQCAFGVALAAVNAPETAAEDAVPNYLRVSQAERVRQGDPQ